MEGDGEIDLNSLSLSTREMEGHEEIDLDTNLKLYIQRNPRDCASVSHIYNAIYAFETRRNFLAFQRLPGLSVQQLLNHFKDAPVEELPKVLYYLRDVGVVTETDYPQENDEEKLITDANPLPKLPVEERIKGKVRHKIDGFVMYKPHKLNNVKKDLKRNGPVVGICITCTDDVGNPNGSGRRGFASDLYGPRIVDIDDNQIYHALLILDFRPLAGGRVMWKYRNRFGGFNEIEDKFLVKYYAPKVSMTRAVHGQQL